MARPNERQRFRDELLGLLREGQYDRAALMQELDNMAPATLSRLLGDLRAEGFKIVSIRDGNDAYYQILEEPDDL